MKQLLKFSLYLFILSACDTAQTSKSIATTPKKNTLNQTLTHNLDSLKIEIPKTRHSIPLELFGKHNMVINYVDENENIISTKINNYKHSDSLKDEYLIEIIAADKRLISDGDFIHRIIDKSKRIYFLTEGAEGFELLPIEYHRPDGGVIGCFFRRNHTHFGITYNKEYNNLLLEVGQDDTIIKKNQLMPFFQLYFDDFHTSNDYRMNPSKRELVNRLKNQEEYLKKTYNQVNNNQNNTNIKIIRKKIDELEDLIQLLEIIDYNNISIPSKLLRISFERADQKKLPLKETIGILDKIVMKNVMELFYKSYTAYTKHLNLRDKLHFIRVSYNHLFHFILFSNDLKSIAPIPPPPPPQINNL